MNYFKIVKPTFLLLVFVCSFVVAQDKVSVAILDLDPEGLSESEVSIISERLKHELFTTGTFEIFERSKIDAVLQEQGLQLSDVTSNEDAVNIGKLIGVQQIVIGSVGKLGELFTINIRLIDVESGRVLKTANEDCECKKEEFLTKSVRQAAIKLTGWKKPADATVNSETAPRTKDKKKNLRQYFFVGALVGSGSGAETDDDKNRDVKSLYNGTAGGFLVGYQFGKIGRIQIMITGFNVDNQYFRVVDDYTYASYKLNAVLSVQYEYALRLAQRFGLYGRIGIGAMGYEYHKRLTVGDIIEKVEDSTTMVPLGIGFEYHLGRKWLIKLGYDGYFAGDKDILQHGNLLSFGAGFKFN